MGKVADMLAPPVAAWHAPPDEFSVALQAAWFRLLSAYAIAPIPTIRYFARAVQNRA